MSSCRNWVSLRCGGCAVSSSRRRVRRRCPHCTSRARPLRVSPSSPAQRMTRVARASQRCNGATSRRTWQRAPRASYARRVGVRFPAWATCAHSGCSSARLLAPRKTSAASPSSGRRGVCSTTCSLALGMRRDKNVYIANVLKCRPPGNRTPTPLETLACRAYLDRQIELIGPKLLIALGRSAATTLLEAEATHREPARARAPLSGRAADRDVSPGVSASQLARQGEGVGRSLPCTGHHAHAAGRGGLARRRKGPQLSQAGLSPR